MEISFKSKITPMRYFDYSRRTASFNHQNFVDYPWTISTSRIATNVFTNHICDCTACLITDGSKALLMHLSPAIPENHNFSKVLNFISNNLDLNKNDLQAVIAGSKATEPSQDIFNKFKELLISLKIPTTILKNGKGATHIGYRTSTDEVLISNNMIDKLLKNGVNNRDAIFNSFEKVKISDVDYF